MLIIAFLQLVPGTFSGFYHFALGKNSAKKADDLSLNFILGVELFVCLVWFITYFAVFISCYNLPDFCPHIVFWILSGICLAESVAMLFFYFRRPHRKTDDSTALFLSRKTANIILARARNVKSRSDAIVLGFFAGLPELIFTLPLYIASAIVLLYATSIPRALIIILFVVAATIPLFVIHAHYRSGHNLADITRLRIRMKPILRIGLFLSYFFLSMTILILGVTNYYG